MRRLGILGVLALIVLLYRKVTRLWWTFDDTDVLHTTLSHPPFESFTNGALWPQQLFTPLMFSAFELQEALFGLSTSRWYVFHLAIVCLCTFAIYGALRCFLDVGPSLAASALFAAGTPLCSLVTQLSTVHYFVAIAFAALAVVAWAKGWRVVSALSYFAAMLAKEIAVPLPLLLWFLWRTGTPACPSSESRKGQAGVPVLHLVALVAYLVWRRAIIGKVVGAYSWATDAAEWPRVILGMPEKILRILAGPNLVLGGALLVLMLIVIALRGRTMLTLAGLIVAVAPLVPVAKLLVPRYAVIPWLALSIAFVAAASTIRNKKIAMLLLIGVPLLAIAVNRQEWSREFRQRLQMSDEGRFFFDMPPGFLRKPLTPPPVIREINWLKTHLGKPVDAACFFDDWFLCVNDISGRRVWEYQPPKRAMIEVTSSIPHMRQRHCSSIVEKPLQVKFDYRGEALYWDLGPYDQGRYSALILEGREAWELPRRDALHLRGLPGLAIRVRYDSPEGWTTYSPLLELDFVKRPGVSWGRD